MSILDTSQKLILTTLTVGAATFMLTACQKEEPKGTFEKMGDSMQKAADDMGEAIEDATEEKGTGEKIGESLDDAARDAEESLKNAGDAIEEAAEKVKEEIHQATE